MSKDKINKKRETMNTNETSKPPQVGGSELNDMLDVFSDIYDSEINFILSIFWDSGYTVKLGDEMNGFKDQSDCLENIQEAARELTRLTILHYPNSIFSKKYNVLGE